MKKTWAERKRAPIAAALRSVKHGHSAAKVFIPKGVTPEELALPEKRLDRCMAGDRFLTFFQMDGKTHCLFRGTVLRPGSCSVTVMVDSDVKRRQMTVHRGGKDEQLVEFDGSARPIHWAGEVPVRVIGKVALSDYWRSMNNLPPLNGEAKTKSKPKVQQGDDDMPDYMKRAKKLAEEMEGDEAETDEVETAGKNVSKKAAKKAVAKTGKKSAATKAGHDAPKRKTGGHATPKASG